jgi:hypothetical protein
VTIAGARIFVEIGRPDRFEASRPGGNKPWVMAGSTAMESIPIVRISQHTGYDRPRKTVTFEDGGLWVGVRSI